MAVKENLKQDPDNCRANENGMLIEFQSWYDSRVLRQILPSWEYFPHYKCAGIIFRRCMIDIVHRRNKLSSCLGLLVIY
jgi:hypothetical protein